MSLVLLISLGTRPLSLVVFFGRSHWPLRVTAVSGPSHWPWNSTAIFGRVLWPLPLAFEIEGCILALLGIPGWAVQHSRASLKRAPCFVGFHFSFLSPSRFRFYVLHRFVSRCALCFVSHLVSFHCLGPPWAPRYCLTQWGSTEELGFPLPGLDASVSLGPYLGCPT